MAEKRNSKKFGYLKINYSKFYVQYRRKTTFKSFHDSEKGTSFFYRFKKISESIERKFR